MIIVIIGAQWGDEGKGKVVDLLADRFDIVARYQGGHNAGHSVYVGDKAFVLRLLSRCGWKTFVQASGRGECH